MNKNGTENVNQTEVLFYKNFKITYLKRIGNHFIVVDTD